MSGRKSYVNINICVKKDLYIYIIINKVFMQRKILSRENILSVYTHRYIHRHQHTRVC